MYIAAAVELLRHPRRSLNWLRRQHKNETVRAEQWRDGIWEKMMEVAKKEGVAGDHSF
jgi:hypothetical protein